MIFLKYLCLMSKKKSSKKNKVQKQNVKKLSKAKPSKDRSGLAWALIPAIIIITIIAFLPIKDLGFVNWDDPAYVLKNEYVQLSAENIKTAFLAGIHPDYPKGIATNYHPLTMISLMINHSISGLEAGSYHWTNLIIHLVNVYLSFLFFLLIIGKENKLLAALGALIFAIHPLHVESVAWISERKDVLFMMFYLLGLNHYLRFKKQKTKSIIPVIGFFVLSLLSKPSAVTFPIVLILIDYLLDSKYEWKSIANKIPFLVLSLIFGFITINIQGDVAVGDIERFNFIEKISFASYGLSYYLVKFLVPTSTTAFHPYPPSGQLPAFISMSPLLVLGLIGSIAYFFRKNKIVVFGVLFFAVNLALTLQFIQVGPSVVSDRYTYLPYHGLILILISFCIYIFKIKPKLKPIVYGVLGLWLSIMLFRTFNQTKVWKDSKVLWNNVLKKYPGCHYAYKGRAEYYYKNNEYKEAMSDIEKAMERYENEFMVQSMRGNVLRQMGNYPEAINALNKAILLKPDEADLYNNRANAFIRANQSNKAKDDYEKCLQLNPNHKEALSNIGAYYFSINDYKSAIEKFTEAIERVPDQPGNYLNRSGVYLSDGQNQKCIDDATTYLSIGKPDVKAFYYMALAHEELNQIAKAIEQIDKAINMDGNNNEYKSVRLRLLSSQ